MKKSLNCIMLVDDNKVDNFYHERVIRKHGAIENIISMNSAEEALQYLRNDMEPKPQVIFLDINMPGMDGWEFLEEFKNLPGYVRHTMVVVMLTTSQNPDDEAKARVTGVLSDFRSKPLTQQMLDEIIEATGH